MTSLWPDANDREDDEIRVAHPGDDLGDEPEDRYPDVETWMEWFYGVVHRPLKAGTNWCPQWWRHPEAVERLDALWRAWEAAMAEGGGAVSFWWTVHFDPHWQALTSERGPFAGCSDGHSERYAGPLPIDPEAAQTSETR